MSYYTRGAFFGKSSSSIFYQLSSQLNKNSKDMLWMWIVGLASLQLHQKSKEFQNEEIHQCNDEVFKMHPIKHNERAIELAGDNADYKEKNFFELVQLQNQNNDIGTISIENELRMTLYRHWTLYDSICNSNHFVSKLRIGSEPGQKTFKRFLITAGISIEEAK